MSLFNPWVPEFLPGPGCGSIQVRRAIRAIHPFARRVCDALRDAKRAFNDRFGHVFVSPRAVTEFVQMGEQYLFGPLVRSNHAMDQQLEEAMNELLEAQVDGHRAIIHVVMDVFAWCVDNVLTSEGVYLSCLSVNDWLNYLQPHQIYQSHKKRFDRARERLVSMAVPTDRLHREAIQGNIAVNNCYERLFDSHREPRDRSLEGASCSLLSVDLNQAWKETFLADTDSGELLPLTGHLTLLQARAVVLRHLFLWLKDQFPLHYEKVMATWTNEYLIGGTPSPAFPASWLNRECPVAPPPPGFPVEYMSPYDTRLVLPVHPNPEREQIVDPPGEPSVDMAI